MLVDRHRHKGAGGLLTVYVGWLVDYENFDYLFDDYITICSSLLQANATAAIADPS